LTIETADLAIHKTLHVAVPLEQAFDVFTTEIASWWPLATHSVGAGELSVDWRVGGLGVELVDGARHEWFDIVEYSPPDAIGMRWRVSPKSPATDLRVTFTADGGGTRVELFHAGWEAYGDGGAEPSGSYSAGWDTVLGHYTRFTAT
jgi:uncharacterized protein YndB with AHSA1/START domain